MLLRPPRGTAFALVACFVVLGGALTSAEVRRGEPAHVGSNACIGCHADEAKKWDDSHHAWAWRPPTADFVKADFAGESITHAGETAVFSKDGDRYVATISKDNERRFFHIEAAVGVEPLQQYLVETQGGRLQALDQAWDTEKREWYHLYPDQNETFGEGLHWSGPYKNWNARCAECHATAYKKNYDTRTKTYASTQAEIGVGCEACHGPGAAHVAWARDKSNFDAASYRNVSDIGLTLSFSQQSPESEIQQCAGCHSRREPLQDGNPPPGTPYHDAYRLALLSPGLYHADGSILDEVYVYGSFLQSKMYAKGVRCSDCHDPHAAELKTDGNGLCTQCHSPAGHPRFSSLRKADYDTPAHHFHEPGTAGAQCKTCHMIERVYMRVDGRRDHSFRIPRPDLSAATGAPNACNDCHSDRDPAWAAAEIARRYPDSEHRGAHFSEVFAKARTDAKSQTDPLFAIASDVSRPAIVRATALDLLKGVADASVAASASRLVDDDSPLVRAAALELQRGAADTERAALLISALRDPVRSVRITAARTLVGTSLAGISKDDAALVTGANKDWSASLAARADFPETHMVLGGVALTSRNLRAARSAFEEAVRQDPQLVPAWTMLIRIALAVGDRQSAEAALVRALAANPDNKDLLEAQSQLGGR